MKSLAGRGFLAAATVFSMLLGLPAAAQQAQLRVVVVTGQDALNNIRLNENRDVVIQVQDQAGSPVMGAAVTFTLPDNGPSGTFPDGTRSLQTTSDAQGRATAAGIRPAGGTGPMQIRVSATYLGLTALAVVPQTNVSVAPSEPPKPKPVPEAKPAAPQDTSAAAAAGQSPQAPAKGGMSKAGKIILILAIAAGAAIAAVVATHSGGSSSGGTATPPPIVITPGTPSVGGPQ